MIRLWTLQSQQVWDKLQEEGVLYADEARSECLSRWPIASEWMRQQMIKRLSMPRKHFPWWAWEHPKPDLRRWRYWWETSRLAYVRLELLLPSEKILLSCFTAWEMVLGQGYVALTEEEQQAWDQALIEARIDDAQYPLPEPWQSKLVASWERIFEIENLELGGAWSTNWVQATFNELRLADVVNITPFTTSVSNKYNVQSRP